MNTKLIEPDVSQSVIVETYPGGISLFRYPFLDVNCAAIVGAGGYETLLRLAQDEGGDLDPNITPERFPVSDDGRVIREPALIDFGRHVTSREVLGAPFCDGWKPADLGTLCVFVGAYPTLQRAYPIVALGSQDQPIAPDGGPYNHVPVAGVDGALRRKLCRERYDGGWFPHYRFLVARPVAASAVRPSADVSPYFL